MPCVAMNTPAIKMPGATWEPHGCGATTTAMLASSATASAAVRPLPTRATAMTTMTTSTATPAALLPSASVYERFWRFLAHHWHSQPHQGSEQPSQHQRCRRSRTSPSRLSASSEMRCRVQILHELEAAIPRGQDDDNEGRDVLHGHGHHSRHTSRGAMQTTCCNCGQRFFRDLGTAPSVSEDAATAKSSRTAYCSLDCRSSSEYRATVQHAVDRNAAFGSPSSCMTSRL